MEAICPTQSIEPAEGGDYPDAQLQLALRALERGDTEEMDALCQNLDWGRSDSNLLLAAGATALTVGRLDLALRCFEELRERDAPYAIAGLQGLAALHERERRPDDALKSLEQITQFAPDNPHFWRLLAEAYGARHRPAAAAAAYRQVLRQNLRRGETAAVRQRLVAQLIEAGDVDGARKELEAVVSADDNLTPDVVDLFEQAERMAAGPPSGRAAEP